MTTTADALARIHERMAGVTEEEVFTALEADQSACKRLAGAVLRTAVHQQQRAWFLARDGKMEFWAETAGFDPDTLRKIAQDDTLWRKAVRTAHRGRDPELREPRP